jgi:hypothetical protein
MTKIQKSMMRTFVPVRTGVGIIRICFPFLLWTLGGAPHNLPLAGSMSAYYHATENCMDPNSVKTCSVLVCTDPETCKAPTGFGPMRNWFVGILFIIGACLYLIHEFSDWEKILLNIAGTPVLMVALNSMPWVIMGKSTGFPIQYVFVMSFFQHDRVRVPVLLRKTLKYMSTIHNRYKVITRYKWSYPFLGVLMVASPITGQNIQ